MFLMRGGSLILVISTSYWITISLLVQCAPTTHSVTSVRKRAIVMDLRDVMTSREHAHRVVYRVGKDHTVTKIH